ncbi:MAG: hypothetical protein CM15mP126_4380 [Gammaproteobacteria bacterium]|nr:MAG: hypothetical protein CM15mP126_4380 [Gammaproteobacteria bacterium]
MNAVSCAPSIRAPCKSLSPGQFSTSVVVVSCPPSSAPVISSGLRPALAAYIDAAYPADLIQEL